MRSLSDKELVASAAWPRFRRPLGHPFDNWKIEGSSRVS